MAVMTIPQGCTAAAPPTVGVQAEGWFPDPAWFGLVDGGAVGTMTDVTSEFAVIFAVPRTGTLTGVEFLVGSTVNINDPTICSIQGIDANGVPDGVVAASVEIASVNTGGVQSWVTWSPFSPGLAVTAGQLRAAHLRFNPASFIPPSSLGFHAFTGWYGGHKMPYTTDRVFAGAWGKGLRMPTLSLLYSDGQRYIIRDGFPSRTMDVAATSFNSGSSPDERGIRFVAPLSGRCHGAAVYVTPGTSEFSIRLYDGSDTVLASANVAAVDFNLNGGANATAWPIWSPVTITAGSIYRLTVRPNTANNVGVWQWAYDVARHAESVLGYLTTRTDAGAWTDTTGTSVHMGLRLEAFG